MSAANAVIDRCLTLARFSEEAGRLTRTFLSPPTHDVHRRLREWLEATGSRVVVDSIGNLRGLYQGRDPGAPRLLIGSHVDTVPGAGAYDGVLGVMLGIALVEALDGRRMRYGIEVIAFSEEEGVRYGVPFLGSRAFTGTFDPELLDVVAPAVREFGLDPGGIPQASFEGDVRAYLEFHIEQGPVLDSLDLPLGIVEGIVGLSRLELRFIGKANHAGTTPMHLRKDALAGAAEWITLVERTALDTAGLVATVGRIQALPGASNVIPGEVRAMLDVRHARDEVRLIAVEQLIASAQNMAHRRGLTVEHESLLNQAAVACDPDLVNRLERAVAGSGYPVHRMPSGAGHDAMILAGKVPIAMLFVRSPGGISHHPDESVHPADVDAALNVGLRFLEELDQQ